MGQDIVRVLRVIEYIGPRDWVELTLAKSIKPEGLFPCHPNNGQQIREVYRSHLMPEGASNATAPQEPQSYDATQGFPGVEGP